MDKIIILKKRKNNKFYQQISKKHIHILKPEMEFFEKKFKNYDQFKDQFEYYQTESFQTYSVRSSVAINEHDPLSKIFKYSKIVYCCKQAYV